MAKNDEVTAIVRFRAKPGMESAIEKEVGDVLRRARNETGYISCEIYQDNDDRAHFLLYERWQTLDDLMAYNAKDFHKDFVENRMQELCETTKEMPQYVGVIQAARFRQIEF